MPNSDALSVLTAEFLTTGQVAGLLGCTKKALADMRLGRVGPPFMLQARGVVVYPAESFRRWLRALPPKGAGCGARESRSRRVARLRTMQAPAEGLEAAR
jgi:hypothetical protein